MIVGNLHFAEKVTEKVCQNTDILIETTDFTDFTDSIHADNQELK